MSTTCTISSLCWNVLPPPSKCAGPCLAIGDLDQDVYQLLKSHKCAGTAKKMTIQDLVVNRLDKTPQNMNQKSPF